MRRKSFPFSSPEPASVACLEVRLARDSLDLRAAQRLRYRVFIEEMGGDGPLVDHAERLERDALDPVFDHLLLVDSGIDPSDCTHVVGAYRLLPSMRRAAAGQFYCESEFDLGPLLRSGRVLLELGRSCIAPEHRGGLGMMQMWQGLADYVQCHGIQILFGAASFRGTDLAEHAAPLSLLHHRYLAPEALRVRGRDAFSPHPLGESEMRAAMAAMPPLIRAYLRLGGQVGEGVFIDHAFQTTDVCVILDTSRMSAQARAFAQRAAVAATK